MKFSILTLFPDIFKSVFSYSIIKRAIDKSQITIEYINLRDFATDSYKSVDDKPYGGGTGMVLRVDIIDKAIHAVSNQSSGIRQKIVLLDAGGTPYSQRIAKKLSDDVDHIILICGHYEGIDERVHSLVDEEISIGDYILTGGEIPAMIVIDSITRLLPDVLLKKDATIHESFTRNLLEYPQYTRPQTYKNISVPPVLLSGNPKNINEWQKTMAMKKTKEKRPDLIND